MTERYNVQASTILGDNYNITNIECSDYNPNIDNSITVTITVTDVYGDAISDESVTVTASEGNFTQLNGSNITNASSVTGTTNSSGQFTLTYNCSEWGLITFSANNVNAQVNVIGWRTLTYDTWQTIKYNDEMCQISIHSESLSFGTSWSLQNANILGDMKNTLKPKNPVISRSYSTAPNFLAIKEDGGLYKKSDSGSSNTSGAYCTLLWRYK